jgi:ABC-type Fe3+/spermidine/putrescine transport system ATPase subunit
MIAGFTPPTSGTVLLDGRDVTTLAPHRRDIGMVFQNYALFPHMTAAGNISFPLEMRALHRAEIRGRVEDALSLVGLRRLGDRYPRQLSGGQQQRVALARALVFRPKLLLMDEPLGALDRKLRDELQSEVRELQQRLGISALYVTHDQDEALVMSDRIAVLREGGVVQIGTGDDLYDRPASLFVAEFIGESNILRGHLRLVGDGSILSSDGWSLRVPRRADAISELPGRQAALVVRPEKVQFRQFEPGSPPWDEEWIGLVARARAATRLGAVWRYEFELPGGRSIRATAPAGVDEVSFFPGERMALRWRRDDGLLLPAEEEEGEDGADG